ncbi:uncharacterized protein LOC106091268 [Stomoxys calcitrans]|uniref:uncharacterized protein LOC106091268 n=1 Tax=Stomoxys calcitrans TaxID=35570 RepID=UPI0027E3A157|nr:uncharacterized protein LOC106091268 [Stomoxys calcitrans]
MNSVWLLFKLLEALLGIICLGYHTRGFLNVDFVQSHYTYCCVFGGATLIPMFGCIRICLRDTIHPFCEGVINLLAALFLFGVSLNSMFHAEKDFYLVYLSSMDIGVNEEPPHPFFKYSKAQSISALCCGCLFLLHSVFAFDLTLNKAEDSQTDDDSDESDDEGSGDSRVTPTHLYVCGKFVHKWLKRYDWFKRLD